MPPPAASAKSLTDAEVATLRKWIQEGAEFKPHWAFVAPVKVEPPHVPAGSPAVNVIDNFILARLAKEGLKPSREADKGTLINRVTLTLTGFLHHSMTWTHSWRTRAQMLTKSWWTGCWPRPLMASI